MSTLGHQQPDWVTLSQIGYANTRMSYTVSKRPGAFVINWKIDNCTLGASISHLGIGDAPVFSPTIPGLGSVTGEYTFGHEPS